MGHRAVPADSSAATLPAAVRAHVHVVISDTDVHALGAYVREIGAEEAAAPPRTLPNSGSGLNASYFGNTTPSGNAAAATRAVPATQLRSSRRTAASPGPGVPADGVSARWVGKYQAPLSGKYQFRTTSDEGVRLWVNGQLQINNRGAHTQINNHGLVLTFTAGQRYAVVEYWEGTGSAVARLHVKTPSMTTAMPIPLELLSSP